VDADVPTARGDDDVATEGARRGLALALGLCLGRPGRRAPTRTSQITR